MMSGVALALLAVGQAGLMSFEGPFGWVILDDSGELRRSVETIGGQRPIDLAVSNTGALAFTTKADATGDTLLFFLDVGQSTPVRLGFEHGFHADPAFTPNGKSIVFVFNEGPGMGAPGSGSHAEGGACAGVTT